MSITTPKSAGFNHQPVIATSPRKWGVIGHDYYYQITATDPDNQPLTYQLLAAPDGMTLTEGGIAGGEGALVRFRPQAPGDYYVSLFVSDGIGGAMQSYEIYVSTYTGNQAPLFTSDPPRSATAGQQYRYQVTGRDVELDAYAFLLEEGPDNMVLDPATGTLLWLPDAADVGVHEVTIAVIDSLGARRVQEYDLTTRGLNLAPAITSTPVVTARQNQLYRYQVTAADPEGQAVTFSLTDATAPVPDGMSIDPTSGEILWTPGSPATVAVTVRVSDVYGSGSEQTFAINVSPAGENQGPVITSTPDAYYAVVGETYTYQVTAYDADPDTNLAYTLAAGPADATFDVDTRTLSWTPTPGSAGASATVTITVNDGLVGVGQSFTLLAVNNTPPVLGSLADQQITAGQTMRLAIPASDPEGYALAYELLDSGSGIPSGGAVDEFGRITWATSASDANTEATFTFLATDVYGSSVQGSFTVTVNPDTQAPVFLIEQSAATIALGETATFVISVTDDVAFLPESLTITVNGEPVPVSPVYGGYSFTYTATVSGGAGEKTITASATDAAGNLGVSEATLQVFDPSDPPPVLAFDPELETVEITAPRDILGLVDDPSDNLTNYRLSLVSEEGIERELAAGTTEVGSSDSGTTGVLGQLDPTLLANGSYTLRLVAEDAAGNTSVAESLISINGRLKLGNFNLSFTDLSLPLGGIPITISRTYDTLNANKQGDFGYGWNLDIANLSVRADVATLGAIPRDGASGGGDNALAGLEDAGILTPWRYGTRLNVRLPDGTLERYTVSLKALEGADGAGAFLSALLNIYTVDLIPDRPTSGRLSLSQQWQVLLNPDTGELETPDGVPFNPASSLLDIDYTYTTRDGVQYAMSGDTGKLQNITDRNGNRLEITVNGLRSVSPTGVTIAEILFTRDHLGRITAITDPNGFSVRYTYDATGDLVSVTDRLDAITTLQYAVPDNPHVLSKITNALGQDAMTLQYDPDSGRITSLGVPGAAIPFSYRLDLGDGRFAEQVADANNVPTILVRDARGKLVRRIQRLTDNVDPEQRTFLITVWQFDDNDNTTHESDTFRVTGESAIYDVQAPYWRSIRTYDAAGSVTSETNAVRLTTFLTYDSNGNLLTHTDSAGNTTSHEYDTHSRLIRRTDAVGVSTTHEYDTNANPIAVRNSLGASISSSTYDPSGRLLSSTPAGATGSTTYFAYDTSENQTDSWQTVTTDEGTFQIVKQSSYDTNGNRNGTARIVTGGSGEQILTSTSTEYNDLGQQTRTVDENGLATEFVYDYRSQLIETRRESRNPDGSRAWLLSRTVFDNNGRTIYSTKNFLEGQSPAQGYMTLTDDQGRSIGAQTYKDPVVDLMQQADGMHAVLTSPGTLISSTSTEYDERGRESVSTDQFGSETRYLYDLAGRTVQTRQQARDENDQLVWVVSEQVFDALGRILVSTDKHVEGQPTAGTRSVYDSIGRQVRSEHLWGVAVQVTVDALTGLATATASDPGTVVSSTETRYNLLGQVSESIDARGGVTTYEYDNFGRTIATIGPAEDVVEYDVPIRQRTETIYDDQGRAGETWSRIVMLPDGTQDRRHVISTSLVYDELGRVVQINLPDGTSTRTKYDDLGRRIAEIDQAGRVKRNEYAAADVPGTGNLSAVILPGLAETALPGTPKTTGSPRHEYEYDARGALILMRDALGRETAFTYDSQGRQLTRTLPLGQVEFIEYDDLGRESLHTSFEGVVIRFTYDDRPGSSGRLLSKDFYPTHQAYEDALAGLTGAGPSEVWTYRYTAFGQLAEVVQDRDGDLATTADARPEVRAYDLAGRLRLITTPEGTINYTYDLTTGDHTGTRTGIDPVNPTTDIVYSYDTVGRLALVSNLARFGETLVEPENTTYAYDLKGALAQQVYANEVIADYTNDILGRPVELTQTRPDGLLLASYRYILGFDGRRLGVVETQLADQALVTYETTGVRWSYDNAGRLSREEHDLGIADSFDWQADFAADRQVDYILDLAGNRLWQVSDFNGDGLSDEQIGYTYDANNRLLVEEGRIVDDVVTTAEYFWGADIVMSGPTGDGTHQTGVLRYEQNTPEHVLEDTEYLYNLHGQLAEANTQREEDGQRVSMNSAYEYNQEHIRYRKAAMASIDGSPASTATKEYLVDPNNPTGYQEIVEERTTTGGPDGRIDVSDTMNLAGLAVTVQADSNHHLQILLPDALGSTRLLVDRWGEITDTFNYDAFGNFAFLEGTVDTQYLYGGQQYDVETSLRYLRARYEDMSTGRFLTMDPLAGLGGIMFSNPYVYALANPVLWGDPTGLAPETMYHITPGSTTAAGILSDGLDPTLGRGGFSWLTSSLDLHVGGVANIPTNIVLTMELEGGTQGTIAHATHQSVYSAAFDAARARGYSPSASRNMGNGARYTWIANYMNTTGLESYKIEMDGGHFVALRGSAMRNLTAKSISGVGAEQAIWLSSARRVITAATAADLKWQATAPAIALRYSSRTLAFIGPLAIAGLVGYDLWTAENKSAVVTGIAASMVGAVAGASTGGALGAAFGSLAGVYYGYGSGGGMYGAVFMGYQGTLLGTSIGRTIGGVAGGAIGYIVSQVGYNWAFSEGATVVP